MGVPLPVSLPPVSSTPAPSVGLGATAPQESVEGDAGFEQILSLTAAKNDIEPLLMAKNVFATLPAATALETILESAPVNAQPVFQRNGLGAFNARLAIVPESEIRTSLPISPSVAKESALITRLGGTGLIGSLSSSVLALLGDTKETEPVEIHEPGPIANAPVLTATAIILPQVITPLASVLAGAPELTESPLPLDALSQRVPKAMPFENMDAVPTSLFERFAAKVGGKTPGAFLNALEVPVKNEATPQLVMAQSGNELALVSASAESAAAPKIISHATVPVDRLHEVLVREARNASPDAPREFTIRLDPASLGRIEVKLDVKADGYVTAVIQAEQSSTYDLLRQNARGLDQSLTDSGLKTDQNSLAFAWTDNRERKSFSQLSDEQDTEISQDSLAPLHAQPQRRWFPFLSSTRVDVSA